MIIVIIIIIIIKYVGVKKIMTEQSYLQGQESENLLKVLTTWGNTTTIILHSGCVFEFKGVFPDGKKAEGFYNLKGNNSGFEGHLNLSLVDRISFQVNQHRGRDSYAFVFENSQQETIFKVFVGRDEQGQLIATQVEAFKRIQSTLTIEELP